jgi:Zn-finger nucleic acid-binding protein
LAQPCPRCGEALQGTEAKCPKCGRPLAAPALASTPSKAPACPVCKLAAYAAAIDGQEALHCAECQGLGLRREALMKLQPYGKKELQTGAEERDYRRPPFFEPRKKPPFLICPFCGKRMGPVKLGKTELDQCEKCDALWLEGPKLPQLADLIGPYKSRLSRPRESRLDKMRRDDAA